MVCDNCGSKAEFYVTFYDRDLVCVSAAGRVLWQKASKDIRTLADLAVAIKTNDTKYPEYPAGYGCACKDCDEATCARICFEDGTTEYDVETAFRKAFPQVFGGGAPAVAAKTTTPVAATGKIRTEDCVAYAILHLTDLFDLSSISKDWKRRSKRKVGDAIERVFEVMGAKERIVIVERGGVITDARVED